MTHVFRYTIVIKYISAQYTHNCKAKYCDMKVLCNYTEKRSTKKNEVLVVMVLIKKTIY